MNFDIQVEYWKSGSVSDIETAGILIEKKKIREGLFFCHLSIEKILKSIYVKVNNDLAPKSHNLLFLIDKTNISLDNEKIDFLGILMKYQLEGRYPEYGTKLPEEKLVKEYFENTKGLLQWLIQELEK